MDSKQKFSIGETVRVKKTGALAEILFYDSSDKTYRVDLKASIGPLWYHENEIEPYTTQDASTEPPRVIKFRAKDAFKPYCLPAKWWYGGIMQDGEETWICAKIEKKGIISVKINPNTVGQYIGHIDSNLKEIYEGDIVQIDGMPTPLVVVWDEYCACFSAVNYDEYKSLMHSDIAWRTFPIQRRTTIVGNIHDNPELLKQEPGAK